LSAAKFRHLARADVLQRHHHHREPRRDGRGDPAELGRNGAAHGIDGQDLVDAFFHHHRGVVLAQQHLQRGQQVLARDRLDGAEGHRAADRRMHRVRLAQVVAQDHLGDLAHVEAFEVEAGLFRAGRSGGARALGVHEEVGARDHRRFLRDRGPGFGFDDGARGRGRRGFGRDGRLVRLA